MDKGRKITLRQLEEWMECTTYTSVTNLTKRNQSLEFSPITEPLAFLTAITNTHTLACTLFTNSSPLTQGLQDLQLLMLQHLHKGKLACTTTFQADLFVYVLWGIYECIDNYSGMCLTEGDLQEGACLANLLVALHQQLLNCLPFYHMQCPAVLLSCTKTTPAASDNSSQQHNNNNKCLGRYQQHDPTNGGYGAKKHDSSSNQSSTPNILTTIGMRTNNMMCHSSSQNKPSSSNNKQT